MKNVIDLIEEGKLKSFFRTRDKISFENAITHVTQHASGTELLFLERSDYLYMLLLIKETCKKFHLDVLSFVLMLNHLHLLLRLHSANLTEAMKNLFERYAMYFNNKYQRRGHVFSGAFRSSLCFDESYLLAASLYIHFNPVKAHIVLDAVNYRWSSAALFLNDIEKETFVDYKYILSALNPNIAVARRQFKELLENLKVSKIDNTMPQHKVIRNIADGLKERLDLKHIGENTILEGSNLETKMGGLKSQKRLRKPQDKEARRFLIRQLKARGFGILEIAQKLNLSRQSIHSAMK